MEILKPTTLNNINKEKKDKSIYSNYYDDELLKKYEYIEVPIIRGFDKNFNQLIDILKNFGAWICGGYAIYCTTPSSYPLHKNKILDKRKPSDIDVYFPSKELLDNCLKLLHEKHFIYNYVNSNSLSAMVSDTGFSKSFGYMMDYYNSGIRTPFDKYKNKSVYDNIFQNNFSSDLYNELSKKYDDIFYPTDITIQFINPDMYKNNIIETLDTFDFVNCCVGIDLNKNKAYAHKKYLKTQVENCIIFNKIYNPILTIHRLIKYLKKGYVINHIEIMKLFLSWESLDNNIKDEFVDLFLTFDDEKEEYEEFLHKFSDLTTKFFGKSSLPYTNNFDYIRI